jgi:signal peptidase I
MAFEFAYAKTGDGVLPAKNFELAAGYTPVKGDVVKFDASQKLVKAVAADTSVLGVLESAVFEGVGVAVKTGQVKYSNEAVYRTPYTGTTPVIGTAYPINASQVLNGSGTTGGLIYKVIGLDTANSIAYVTITATTF